MPRLVDMDIDTVSLVDKGANNRRFAVLKRASVRGPMVSAPDDAQSTESGDNVSDDTEPESGVRAALGKIADALGLSDEGREFVGFVDNHGQPLTAETVTKAVDSYRDFVLDALKVEKAGRKISGARMTQLKNAMSVLGDLINGVEEGYWTPPNIEKGHEVDDMNEQELRELVAKTVSDTFTAAFADDGAGTQAIAKAVAGVQKSDEAPAESKEEAPAAPVETAAPAPAATETSAQELADAISKRLDEFGTTQGQVIEAVAKVAERLDNLEGGARQSGGAIEKGEKPKTITKREKGDMSSLHGILG